MTTKNKTTTGNEIATTNGQPPEKAVDGVAVPEDETGEAVPDFGGDAGAEANWHHGQVTKHLVGVEASARGALVHAWHAGRALAKIKSGLTHGQWEPWVAQHFDGSMRTAQAYMRVERKTQRVADLPKGVPLRGYLGEIAGAKSGSKSKSGARSKTGSKSKAANPPKGGPGWFERLGTVGDLLRDARNELDALEKAIGSREPSADFCRQARGYADAAVAISEGLGRIGGEPPDGED
jgi:hypothetical protein